MRVSNTATSWLDSCTTPLNKCFLHSAIWSNPLDSLATRRLHADPLLPVTLLRSSALLECPARPEKVFNIRRLNLWKKLSEILAGQVVRSAQHGKHDLALDVAKHFPLGRILKHGRVRRQLCDVTLVNIFRRVVCDFEFFPWYMSAAWTCAF